MSDVIDFVRSYREPVSIYEVAGELAALGANGAGWPRATADEWKRKLEQLVDDGKLQLNGSLLSVTKPKGMIQGELF